MELQTDKKGQVGLNPRDISICTAEMVSFEWHKVQLRNSDQIDELKQRTI